MLALRPNCEGCDKDLPPSSTEACICTYECTFCRDCVDNILRNVCPNCGGGFAARPIRPQKEYRKGLSVTCQPASIKRVNTLFTESEINAFSNTIKDTLPEHR